MRYILDRNVVGSDILDKYIVLLFRKQVFYFEWKSVGITDTDKKEKL